MGCKNESCSNGPGHVTKITMPIYRNNRGYPNLVFGNQRADDRLEEYSSLFHHSD